MIYGSPRGYWDDESEAEREAREERELRAAQEWIGEALADDILYALDPEIDEEHCRELLARGFTPE